MKKLLSFIVSVTISLSSFAAESWSVMAPLPVASNGHVAVVMDSLIYVIGGSNAGTMITDLRVYNTHTNSWSTGKSLTSGRVGLTAAAIGHKIYVIGGYNAAGALDLVEEYDPATDTWTTKTPMPIQRSEISAAVIGGKIYVTGGWPGSYTELDIYDPATDKWTTGTPAPAGRLNINGGEAFANKLYTTGGKDYDNINFYDNVDIYDAVTDKWSAGPAMPQGRYACPNTVLKNRLYVLGGTNGGPFTPSFKNNDYYDASTGTWHTALPLLVERAYGDAVTVDNKIYLIGGVGSDGNSIASVHRYIDSALTTSVEEGSLNLQPSLGLYPNPTQSLFMVQLNTPLPCVATIEITDISGRSVSTQQVESGKPVAIELQVSPGTYFLTARTPDGSCNSKINIIK